MQKKFDEQWRIVGEDFEDPIRCPEMVAIIAHKVPQCILLL